MPVFEVARVLYIGPLAFRGVSEFTFRIEILRNRNAARSFSAKLWRMDHYRLRPTFPDKPQTVADEEVLVADVAAPDGAVGASASEVERKVLAAISSRFLGRLANQSTRAPPDERVSSTQESMRPAAARVPRRQRHPRRRS